MHVLGQQCVHLGAILRCGVEPGQGPLSVREVGDQRVEAIHFVRRYPERLP